MSISNCTMLIGAIVTSSSLIGPLAKIVERFKTSLVNFSTV